MDGDELAKLRKLTGQLHKLTYEAVKAGAVAELPDEEQLFARAMQEHMHLKHIHNALEFADLRQGAPYEIEFEGNVVSPLAHVALHAAVKGQLEQVRMMYATRVWRRSHGCKHTRRSGNRLSQLPLWSFGRGRTQKQLQLPFAEK